MLREGMKREARRPGTGCRFTDGKDCTEICIPQYRKGFLRLLGKGGRMNFNGCQWTNADVEQLVVALKYAHAAEATTQPR